LQSSWSWRFIQKSAVPLKVDFLADSIQTHWPLTNSCDIVISHQITQLVSDSEWDTKFAELRLGGSCAFEGFLDISFDISAASAEPMRISLTSLATDSFEVQMGTGWCSRLAKVN